MKLSDEEISIIYRYFEDWVRSSEYWADEEQEEKSALLRKVYDEAKRRKLWWAR